MSEEQIPELEPYLIEYICPDCEDDSSWISLSGKNICPIHKKHVTQKIFAYMKESVHEREKWICNRMKNIRSLIATQEEADEFDEFIEQLERKE